MSPDLAPAATDLCAVLMRAGLPLETALLEDPSLRPIVPGVFSSLDVNSPQQRLALQLLL